MTVIKEGTPNGDLKDLFKRAFLAFIAATREGIDENIREQDEYAAEIQAEILKQAAGQQHTATETH